MQIDIDQSIRSIRSIRSFFEPLHFRDFRDASTGEEVCWPTPCCCSCRGAKRRAPSVPSVERVMRL